MSLGKVAKKGCGAAALFLLGAAALVGTAGCMFDYSEFDYVEDDDSAEEPEAPSPAEEEGGDAGAGSERRSLEQLELPAPRTSTAD